ncbi:MAG: phytoene desaturase family protein [Chloroflexi bacterium]|nr:phytoene desaturase family protein [Chloroflexota bacterium]
MAKSVIVIGGGLGGLAAAARLARAGFEVTVLEKNAQVGGQISEVQAAGFRWSIGPPAITARPLLEELFNDLGRELQDYLRLLPLDPQTRYFFSDGLTYNTRLDWSATAAEIAQIDARDVSGYLRYLAYAASIHQLRRYGFGRSLHGGWFRAGPLASADAAARRFIRSDKLRRALSHHASQSGGSPFAVAAAYSELAHAALNSGLWHPRDGLAAIARALENLAAEFKVSIRLGCPVARIEIERSNAIGVALESGEIMRADAVVSNVCPISTARYLLPEWTISATALRSLMQTPMSSSAFILLLGIRGASPRLAHHNIFFSDDFRAEYEHIFQRGLMPADPTITLTISSKTDPPSAPGNQENWLIRVSAPPLSEKVNWATEARGIRDRILTILQGRYGLELHDRIRFERHFTPADLSQLSGAWRGALHGSLPHGPRAALTRPRIRSPHLKRLYHAGGAVVPGGGLPQALLSAKAAAALLIQDLG